MNVVSLDRYRIQSRIGFPSYQASFFFSFLFASTLQICNFIPELFWDIFNDTIVIFMQFEFGV